MQYLVVIERGPTSYGAYVPASPSAVPPLMSDVRRHQNPTVPIVEATAADSHVALSVERAAFAREDEAALVADLFRDPSAQPSLSLLAFLQDKPVGHVLFTKAVLAGASRKVPAAILAPLAVLPEFQRQGVGRALIEHGASLLAASGVQLLFVLGHPGYYTRCGFVPAFPFGLRAPIRSCRRRRGWFAHWFRTFWARSRASSLAPRAWPSQSTGASRDLFSRRLS